MTKLTDIHVILLSRAAARDRGDLLPLPEALARLGEPARKAIQQLLRRGLAAEAETNDGTSVFRDDGDLRFGVVITDAGKHAIGAVEPERGGSHADMPAVGATKTRSDTKQARVLELLRREQGASVDELVQATGWLPHTTRAALTGIRKRGIALDKIKLDGVTRYKAEPAQ